MLPISSPRQFRGLVLEAQVQELLGDPALARLHLTGAVLVSVDEEAREEAVGPVWVVEEPVLLRVEDLQPDLIPLPERQDGGA